MLYWIAITCLFAATALLIALSHVDMKTRLLPNEMVLGFATLGFVFHLTTYHTHSFVSIPDIFLGGFMGFAPLYLIRAIANHLYKTDAMGLGDVKLMGAGGLWLGPEGIWFALCLGALAAALHGLVYELNRARTHKTRPDFSSLQIPAGPGFAAGIFLTGVYKFWGFAPL